MKAVEFKTTINNGMIEIPKDFENEIVQEVRVILLFEEKKDSDRHRFSAAKIRTKNFKFSREEANER